MKNNLENILVSVIIPIYNVAAYLNRCVKSVFMQTHKNIEIILIDDGSTDECPLLCDGFAKKDGRVKVIHRENGGLANARNTGLDNASGDWVCFIDGDDFVDADFISVLLDAAVSNDCILAKCKCKYTFQSFADEADSGYIIQLFDWFDYFIFLDNTQGYNVYHVWAAIYHKSVFENLRFIPFSHTEDAPVTSQIIWNGQKQKFAVTDRILYYYYQSPQSIIRGAGNLKSLGCIEAFDWLLDYWGQKNEWEIYDAYFKNYFIALVNYYCLLRRDMPDQYSEYRFLEALIYQNLKKARRLLVKPALLPPLAQEILDELTAFHGRLVVYGYHYLICEAVPWLRFLGIELSEIWDEQAPQLDANIDGIQARQPYTPNGLESVKIIIAAEDRKTGMEISRQLRGLGYDDFVSLDNVFEAIKYGKYKAFLPYMLTE